MFFFFFFNLDDVAIFPADVSVISRSVPSAGDVQRFISPTCTVSRRVTIISS